jgi:hypothetical protein
VETIMAVVAARVVLMAEAVKDRAKADITILMVVIMAGVAVALVLAMEAALAEKALFVLYGGQVVRSLLR